MKAFLRGALSAVLAVALLVGMGGCGGSSRRLTDEQQRRATTHATALLRDMNEELILARNDREYLEYIGVLISENEVIPDMRAINEFVDRHNDGAGGQLTIAFLGAELAFARMISQGGMIYYVRGDWDSRENTVEVNSRIFEELELVFHAHSGTFQLTLSYERRNPVILTFRPEVLF